MYRIGVFPGKFAPPHRGHLSAIVNCSCLCEKMYVVVSHNQKEQDQLFEGTGFKAPTLKEKARWLSIELKNIEHVKILMMDEDDIPLYPYGWSEWSNKLHKLIPEDIDIIFGGEEIYGEVGYTKYFPNTVYKTYDCNRTRFPISATQIRKTVYQNWDYILGAARPFFTKRVLIVGTESCGKTTMTKMLGKIYNTSWAEEYGRYYSTDYMGGNEDVFEANDFLNIAMIQRQYENDALTKANKVVFFDTEALVTQYYCNLYLGEKNNRIDALIDPDRYDLVLYLKPTVKWVDDGFRFKSNQEERNRLDNELYNMFIEYGFEEKMRVIESRDYMIRLNQAMDIIDDLIKSE